MRSVSGVRRTGEVALVVLATALQVLGPTTGAARPDPAPGVATLGAVLGLAQGLALLGRRTAPGRTGLVVVTGAAAAGPARAAGPAVRRAGRRLVRRPGARASRRAPRGARPRCSRVLGVTALRWPDANGWVPLAVVVTVAVALGAALVEARAAASRRWRTGASLERERDTAVARAAVEERLRIARDLHDLVGHGLTGIAVQSSTARLAVEDGDLDRATTALRAVERSAREALAEVRQLLGVLRSDTARAGAGPRRPARPGRRARGTAGADVRARPAGRSGAGAPSA